MPAFFVLPDQLFADITHLPKDTVVYFFESDWHTRRLAFHKQKLILQRAGMQAVRERLLTKGYQVEWCSGSVEALFEQITQDGFADVSHYTIVDLSLAQHVREVAKKQGIRLMARVSEQFMAKPGISLVSWFDFYAEFRSQYSILITSDQKPVGGRWSFATQPNQEGPYVPPLAMDDNRYSEEAIQYVATHFPTNPGDGTRCIYPVTHNDAVEFLEDFLEFRLPRAAEMGKQMSADDPTMAASMLTPLLHHGLLTTRQVIMLALEYAEEHPVPLVSLEAFIREVVREYEYPYALYHARYRQKPANIGGVKKQLNTFSTGIPPVDTALYRLEVVGYLQPAELNLIWSFLTLLTLGKSDISEFFLKYLVGSADWSILSLLSLQVPYYSSADILVSSNYAPGAWCELWDALFLTNLARQTTRSREAENLLHHLGDDGLRRCEKMAKALIQALTA